VGDISPQYQPILTKIEVKDAKDKASQLPEVIDLSFGIHHAAAVTKSGDLYTWGSNEQGQCGMRKPRAETLAKELGLSVKEVDPTKIMIPKLNTLIAADGTRVARVVCGERHTSVLDQDGCIWGFGAGESHQIGVMDNVDQEVPLRAVLLGDKKMAKTNPEVRVVDIDVGSAISSAVTETGDVYLWGFSMESPVPKRVPGIRGQRFQRAAVGGYENVCGLTGSANEVYELHYGEDDDDGSEEIKLDTKPKKNSYLRGKRLRGIGAGRAHYAVITEAGRLLMWGNNQDLQLGLPEDINEVPHPMEVAPRWQIASIACSYEHSIAVTVDGKVITWGGLVFHDLHHHMLAMHCMSHCLCVI
jgi:alpha-tubulin suppressor-like RCC1 family protein